jgi:hypothetical protein
MENLGAVSADHGGLVLREIVQCPEALAGVGIPELEGVVVRA